MNEKEKNELLSNFLYAIRDSINYWDQMPKTSREKLEGLAFSILCLLDGVSGSFDADINDLSRLGSNFMFHEQFYRKDDEK